MRTWWSRRGLRSRIVLSSSLLITTVLVIGTVAVAAVYAAGRMHDLDSQISTETATLDELVRTGQLPAVLPLPTGSALLAQVLATDGTVLSATPSASRTQPLLFPRERDGELSTNEQDTYVGVPVRLREHHSQLGDQRVVLVVAAPLSDIRRALTALRTVLLLVVPVLVLGAAAVTWSVSGRALRPVEQLRAAAEQLARKPLATRGGGLLPEQPGSDEIARLGRTLNTLLQALGDLLRQQSAFIQDAAHELRSPVASLQVQVEVAAAHPDLVDLPQLLPDLLHDLDRLSRLTQDLLTLARLESGVPPPRQAVDLRVLAHAQGEPARVYADRSAMTRLVDNLISNAQRYGKTPPRVRTAVANGWAVLDVDDDGPGIPQVDRQRVFDRWVRLDTSRTGDEGGSGLGLAIVREIARTHGGDVTIDSSDLGGTRVRVRLPLAGGPYIEEA